MHTKIKLIGIGDNISDQYLYTNMMYPGGQALNVAVFAAMQGTQAAFLGVFGSDAPAEHICRTLDELQVDRTHCRTFAGENGAASVTLQQGDRVFLGSNKGGALREHPLQLSAEDIQNELCNKSGLGTREAASGIISVVNSNMIRAIRLISVERGYDVRTFSLMAFGGAGPLHACEVAKEMGISSVIFPPAPGTLCSLGLLMADTRFDLGRSKIMLAEPENLAEVRAVFCALIEEGSHLLKKENISEADRSFHCSIDCRYLRQNYEINIPVDGAMSEATFHKMCEDFHREHNRSYGYSNEQTPIQMVNYRINAIGTIEKPELLPVTPAEGLPLPPLKDTREVFFDGETDYVPTAIYDRSVMLPGHIIIGPAIIEQMDSTCVVPPGWEAAVDSNFNIRANWRGV